MDASPSEHALALDRHEHWFLAGILTLALVLSGLMLNPYLTVVNHDSAIYSLLGMAIAQGQGYLLVSEPVSQPYFTFPPLLPLIFAAIIKITGITHWTILQWVFKGLIHLLFILSIPLYYCWLRKYFAKGHAMVLTLLLALNPLVWKYSGDVLADVPYWALSMAALFTFGRCWGAADPQNAAKIQKSWGKLALGLLLIILSLLMRQIGVALALGFLLYLGLYRRWKLLLVCGLILLSALAIWPAYEHHYRSTHEVHQDTLNQADLDKVLEKSPVKLEFIKHFLVQNPISQDRADVVKGPVRYAGIIATRVKGYAEMATELFLPPMEIRTSPTTEYNLRYGLTPLLGALFLVGGWTIFRAYPLMGCYLLFYFGILAVYPYITPRFLLPVFPFVLMAVYQGLLSALTFLRNKWSLPLILRRTQLILIVFVGVTLIGGHLPETIRWVSAGFKLKLADVGPSRREHNRAYYETLVWIRQNTPDDSLLITRKPPVAYYYSGRKATAFPFTLDTQRLMDYVDEKAQRYGHLYPALYVVEDTAFSESKRFLPPLVQAYGDRFEPVYRHSETGATVWKFNPEEDHMAVGR